jgi:nicotinamide-nucleotide amidase
MHIEVICTGDEVLTGKIVNTNFSYITQKLEDVGLSVQWETTVGDDRDNLLRAFQLAGERADAVIVNGGLGPTVDDLSQEIAAKAAGVPLALNEDWLKRMEDFFQRRSRVMPPNNRKQAMLPTTAEVIDNPIGTACAALDIGQARSSARRPRELAHARGAIIHVSSKAVCPAILKRFHPTASASRGPALAWKACARRGVSRLPALPQLETADAPARPGRRAGEARPSSARCKRLGSFILAEDEQTLEVSPVPGHGRRARWSRPSQAAGRRPPPRHAGDLPPRHRVARPGGSSPGSVSRDPPAALTRETAEAVARAARRQASTTHALAVLIDLDDGPERIEFGGTICLAIATELDASSRQSRILGGRDWVRLGAVEMGLDCLRRYLQGLPVYERIDFEKT